MEASANRIVLLESTPFEPASADREMEAAAAIQRTLLEAELPRVPGFELAAYCRCASRIGGDFYEAHSNDSDTLWVTIADVMGKGVPAALFATSLSPLLRSLAEQSRNPAELLTRLNNVLGDELARVEMFITAQILRFDLRRRELWVAGAGHCPLLIAYPHDSSVLVPADGLPLGLEPAAFRGQRMRLRAGACLLLYTDGVTEARNDAGERFGHHRLEAFLRRACRLGFTAAEIKQALVAELELFEGSTLAADDQTFVVLADRPDTSDC